MEMTGDEGNYVKKERVKLFLKNPSNVTTMLAAHLQLWFQLQINMFTCEFNGITVTVAV